MNLSGLRVRNNLRILITGKLICSKDVSIMETITMKKSICDQVSLRYEPLSIQKPRAVARITLSKAKAAVKKRSKFSETYAKVS